MSAKRILFAAEFWEGATGKGLAQGLIKDGHTVECIDFNLFLSRFGSSIPGRIANRLLRRHQVREYNRAILDAARVIRPEVFISIKGSFISKSTLAALAKDGAYRVNFYPDVAFAHPGVSQKALAQFDRTVTTKSYQLEWLSENFGEERTAFVHHGFCEGVHAPVDVPDDDAGFDWDICYIGNHSNYKCDWLSAVCAAFPDKRIAIVGNRWTQFQARLPGATLLPAVYTTDYSRLISRSRINLAIHFGPDGPQGWQDNVSTRSFEIPACQGFMLHIDNEEIRSLFKPGSEIDLFNTTGELASRIRQHLENPEKRMKIAKAGHGRAVPAYGYHMRSRELMSLVDFRRD